MMKWTEEQRQVIDERGHNILVSAAAGSGKTAVLIQRIMSRITDPVNPVNVDEFLVVTFTKAAAAQMKERLQKALDEALSKEPDNQHLQRQVMLVPMAQISTIHSFCGYVIQNYFHRIGVDPAYRVGSNSELSMMKSDVIQDILEEKYQEGSEDFLQLAQLSCFVKSDKQIEDLVLMLYSKAMSEPFPHKFLQRLRSFLQMDTVEELSKHPFIEKNVTYAWQLIKSFPQQYENMLAYCNMPYGPLKYHDFLAKEAGQFEQIGEMTSFDRLRKLVFDFHFDRLPNKGKDEVDEELKKAVQDIREDIKDTVKNLKEDIFAWSLEEQWKQLSKMQEIVFPILDLTEEFIERYRQAKAEKSLVDFNDLEQMALEILIQEDGDGNVVSTEAARELEGQFAEIMIDEYQDSNLVQDILLSSVSTGHNLFMVGDIKQSIYRFRMARPELFLEKMGTYETQAGAENRLIYLSKNFRSRQVVLEGTNAVFDQIMRPDMGGVDYDEAAKLRVGAAFPETEKRTAKNIDVYGLNGKSDGTYEGKVIADKIKEYTGEDNPLYVWEDGEYRKAEYRDITILMRSTKTLGQDVYDVLAAEGIPVHMENSVGFFDTWEISVLVSLFEVIDNPRQDIPLAAVMKSPIGEFTDDELARIRGLDKKKDFYDSLLEYDEKDELQQKIQHFLQMLKEFREKRSYATVADMLQEIFDRTHFDYLLMAMKNGKQRSANVERLMQLAREFDQTVYRGLYQFVRYISGIKNQEEDLGEANPSGDQNNMVQIMTIHKSKGLEFPICFLAGMGREFSSKKSGKSSLLVLNSDMGIASKLVDNHKGVSINGVFYQGIKRMNRLEDMGEELRVLYVAMTRAKEKLVLVGRAEEKMIESSLDYYQRSKASCFYNWILPTAAKNPLFEITWVDIEQLEQAEVRRQAELLVDEVMLNNFDTSLTYNQELKEKLEFVEAYEPEKEQELPTKLSVSEIKSRKMTEHEDEGFTVLYTDALENQSPVPAFAREETEENQALAGANYGTIWHQAMAGLDFVAASREQMSNEQIHEELEKMVDTGRMRASQLEQIPPWKVRCFLQSGLGREMTEAQKDGRLYREQPFVIGVDAEEVVEDAKDNHTQVLVQGIVDGFYETDTGLVVMDYKTDRLEEGQEQQLVQRYQSQLELYARALEKITGKTVERKVLYSFSLNKEIEV